MNRPEEDIDLNGSFTFRPIQAEEFPRFMWAAETAFGEHYDQEQVLAHMDAVELERTMAAFDGGDLVGTLAVLSLELTLPGGALLPAGGVTWVGVLPTHRRRGVLTRLMWRALRDSENRGEPVSALLASEAPIYGRYGYGPATSHIGFEIERARATFREPAPHVPGRFRQVEKEEAARLLPVVYDRTRTSQPGAVSRTPGWWRAYFADPEQEREGAGPLSFIVHEDEAGHSDGYLAYRVKEDWQQWLPNNTLVLVELFTVSPALREAFWRLLLSMDLMRSVQTIMSPVDELLPWALTDARQLRVRYLSDELWVRLLDIPRALAARSYGLAGRLILEVTDPLFPRKSGPYLLDTSAEGADVSLTEGPADIALDVSALGAVYLGGVSFELLRQAGRLEELRPGACREADLLFAVSPRPFCGTIF